MAKRTQSRARPEDTLAQVPRSISRPTLTVEHEARHRGNRLGNRGDPPDPLPARRRGMS